MWFCGVGVGVLSGYFALRCVGINIDFCVPVFVGWGWACVGVGRCFWVLGLWFRVVLLCGCCGFQVLLCWVSGLWVSCGIWLGVVVWVRGPCGFVVFWFGLGFGGLWLWIWV